MSTVPAPSKLPECWGHRGASAAYPENTIKSFEWAAQDQADAIETDVHITADGVIVLYHDSLLGRTTTGSGRVNEQNYWGTLEHVRTVQEPVQKIPTFNELCDFLMQPEYQHVKANIDIKPENDPDALFRLMAEIVHSYPDYATLLSPRLILGLWHPKFLTPALTYVPTLKRIFIGGTPSVAKTYFWEECSGFSLYFPSLLTSSGQAFLRECKQEGKDVMVWTVNDPTEMVQAAAWGVSAILTDKTALLHSLKGDMQRDWNATYTQYVTGTWAGHRYDPLAIKTIQQEWDEENERDAGESYEAAHARRLDVSPALSASSTVVGETSVNTKFDALPNPALEDVYVPA